MPTYEYECQFCEHAFEVVRSFKDGPLIECPECHEAALKQVLSPPTILSVGDPKTLGGIADRNRTNLGHYERESKDHQAKEAKTKARREAMKNLPAGMQSMRSKKPTPPAWWRPGKDKPDLKLAKLSTDKWAKYVQEGKK